LTLGINHRFVAVGFGISDINITGSRRFEFSAAFHGWATLFFCCLAGIAFPSLVTAFALALVLAGIVAISFGIAVSALIY
jgi:hypothetical protein